MDTKWKNILLVMLITISICGVFITLFIFDTQENLKSFVDIEITSVRAIIKTIEEENSRRYRNRIKTFVNYSELPKQEKIISAFARRDRDELLCLSAPYLKIFRKEDPHFSTFSWLTPDNHAFLRVHRPALFGDEIGKFRPDIVDANKNHRQYASYMVAKTGLQYRLVQPISYAGKHVGILQFGLKDSLLLDAIHKKLNLPVGMAVPNEKKLIITHSKLPSLAGDTHTIQSKELSLFQQDNDGIDWSLNQQQVTLKGKTYIITNAFNLLNYKQEPQGYIFVALDISGYEKKLQSRITLVLLLSLTLILISFLILYFSYGALIQKIVTLNKNLEQSNENLEHQVAQRTSKLQREIIDRKQAEKILMESEQRFRTVADFTYDWEYWVAPDNNCVYVSPSCKRITGYASDEFIKNPDLLMEIIYPDDRAIMVNHKHMVDDLNEINSIDFRITTKDGDECWIGHICQPVYDTEGRFIGRRGSNRDITEHKKMQEEVLKAGKLESLGILAGGIAHDFNNLLFMVMGNISLARDDLKFDTGISENLKNAEQACIKAKELSARLITFSKGGDPIKTISSINDLLKDALASALQGSDIKPKFFIADAVREVNIDENQIRQVFNNLIINAKEAMDDIGELKVSCENIDIAKEGYLTLNQGQYIKISFEDHGCGISKENLEQIFDPYFSMKERGVDKGQGLGLAVSYSIITKHSGLITVESESGTGSTFSVYLKAVPAPETGPA